MEKTIENHSIKNVPISYCRVVGMLFIIICHIVKYYKFIPGASILGAFFNVGVEMFILISAYLYGTKKIKSYKDFFVGRYFKVVLPVQCWAIILTLVNNVKNTRGV